MGFTGELLSHLPQDRPPWPPPPDRRRRPPRGKPNLRNEILETAGRGKHFARRAVASSFPPTRARARRASLYKYSSRFGALSSPIFSASLLAPVHIPNLDPPQAPPTSPRPTRTPPPFSGRTLRALLWCLDSGDMQVRVSISVEMCSFAICFFFHFSKAIYRGF